MKTKIFYLPMLLLAAVASACTATAQTTPPAANQPLPATGVLEVQGIGRIKVQPDQTTVVVEVQSINPEAGRAVQQVTERVEQLLKKLQEAGFQKDEIKTSQFYLNENNQWIDNRMVRQGYTASQTMEVKFGLDPKRMTRITSVFADIQEGVTFRFAFGLTDKLKQQTKEELIRKALQDAREKAAIIARSTNIRLGNIRKIDYGVQQHGIYEVMDMQPRNKALMNQEAQFPQTEIQEMELTDQIHVIWNLEQ